MFYVLVGVSGIFLVPLLTDEADARTRGKAVTLGYFTKFRNVNWKLEDGKFVEAPSVSHHPIQWVTTGKGVSSGDEKVRFEAEVGNQRTGYTHITFIYSNPDKGNNSCDVLVQEPSFVKAISDIPCTGTFIEVEFEFRLQSISD